MKKKHTAEINSFLQAIIGSVRILFLVPDRTVRSTGLGLSIVSSGIVPAASDQANSNTEKGNTQLHDRSVDRVRSEI